MTRQVDKATEQGMRSAGSSTWKHALLLVALGSLVALFLIELSVRVATDSLFALGGPNSVRYGVTDAIGRIPRPGLTFRHPKGFTINIGEYGTRRNGGSAPPAERPLMLAVGDSFAFGDQVNDEDSWPAVLERLSSRRVINAGVPGFGIDQAILRAEQLANVYAPDVIIVSFIPHDVLRCEMSYWSGHPKLHFEIDSARLHLQPAPVPSPPAYAALKRLLSSSVALDLFFAKSLHWEGPEAMVVHRQGREVACRLMERLAAFAKARKATVVVLAQAQVPDALPEHLEIKDGLLACAKANRLRALDLFPVIESLSSEQRQALFDGHMTVEGNRLVATELAKFLDQDIGPK